MNAETEISTTAEEISEVQHANGVLDQIANARADMLKKLAFLDWAESAIAPLAAKCSESFTADMSIGIPYLYVYNREDLSVLMTLAHRWEKEKFGARISYSAMINGQSVRILASEGALPPTCKTVTTVRHVEAHDITEETIICDFGLDSQETTAEDAP